MREIIVNQIDKCAGCNHCIRVCPIPEANIAFLDGRKNKVRVDSTKCIACGSCLAACTHGSRRSVDDTKNFFDDLRRGNPISVFAAPAIKSNFEEYGQLFTWLRSMGVRKIYDVSLGADICTWAHIRYIQKNGPKPIISQPCPAIVNYILMHKNELLRYLSPVHSPMLCTAVYMQKYERVGTKIAAISPCVAKAYEFEATDIVDYNVTFRKLIRHLKEHNIVLPSKATGFDNYDAGLGSLYPMPGGLKECVEHYVGRRLRVDKSEGPKVVYKALDDYAKQPLTKLPVLFDVLNCAEGCNAGTGCEHNIDIFDINTKMDALRQAAIKEDNLKYMDDLFKKFDETLHLEDFIRSYIPKTIRPIPINREKIDAAYALMNKFDEASRNFDCAACGCETCLEMAEKIAKGINVPENCVQKMHSEVVQKNEEAKNILSSSISSYENIFNETAQIRKMTENITSSMTEVTDAVAKYDQMVTDIERISEKVNIISLNASVEAAKAGQHGLAFGVVAKEIRSLAQSSAESAMQTKEAAEKANGAITTVNDMVFKIKEKVQSSCDVIETISDNAKKIANR